MFTAASLNLSLLNIFILPFNSLIVDFQRKMDAMGIQYMLWPQNGQLSLNMSQRCNIILTSLDHSVQTRFHAAVRELLTERSDGEVPACRVVIDEAHVIATDTYR